jgi:hypothetical protein
VSCQDQVPEGRTISTSGKKRRPGPRPGSAAAKAASQKVDIQDLERLEEDQQLDQERAKALQAGIGNQSLLALMNRSAAKNAPTSNVEIEIEEEGGELESEQEVEEIEVHESSVGEASGAPNLPDEGALMWGNKELGGEDDPPKPPTRRRSPRRRRVNPEALPDDPLEPSDDGPGADIAPDLQAVRKDAPLRRPDQLLGDEVHDALWGWLQDPALAARAPLEPESLVGLDPVHPLSRCATAGALLAECAPVASARALGLLARPLPGPSSLSATVARAAALATLAQAMTSKVTGIQAANRAVSLVLEDDALPSARRVAWELARTRKMWAPAIFEGCIRPSSANPLDLGGRGASPAGAALLAAGLSRVAGPSGRHEVPPTPRRRIVASQDEDLAWLDAILGGKKSQAGRELLTFEDLAPVIHSVRALVRSAARLQVELAAAATAAWRVAGDPVRLRLRGVLRALWRELGILARGALDSTRKLESLVGKPLSELGATLDGIDAELGQLCERLSGLRADGLSALASVLARGTKPVKGTHP